MDETKQEVRLRKAEEAWQTALRRDRTSSGWRIWHRLGLAFWGLMFILSAVRTVLHVTPSFIVFAWNLFVTVGLLLLLRRLAAIIRQEPHPPLLRRALKAAGPRSPGATPNGHGLQLTTGPGDKADPSERA